MQGLHPKVAILTFSVHTPTSTMSDLPIQPQPNLPEQSPMANISPFVSIGSSLITGGCQVWSSYIQQDTQLKLVS